MNDSLTAWLDEHADALDGGAADPESIVARLAEAGLFSIGVPNALGGSGGTTSDAMLAIASVAERSLTAAFVFWGQRTFIEYLLHSPNVALRDELLRPLLRAELGGATGLSNAMKFLAGIEDLQVSARAERGQQRLSGRLPWVTNLRKSGYVVACAVDHGPERSASVFAVPHDAPGLTRSRDLELIGLRASDTAALVFDDVVLSDKFCLHADGPLFLRSVRPAFLAMQCGLALGLTKSALDHARGACRSERGELPRSIDEAELELAQIVRALCDGLTQGSFRRDAVPLFELRLRLIDLALASVALELSARGGKAYLRDGAQGFARRWNEAAFLPIVTPSSVQLRRELARHRERLEARESA